MVQGGEGNGMGCRIIGIGIIIIVIIVYLFLNPSRVVTFAYLKALSTDALAGWGWGQVVGKQGW